MVTELYAKHTARERPQSAFAAGKLDDSSGFCRSRVAGVEVAPERLVEWCGVSVITDALLQRTTSDELPDPQEYAIGNASRAHVHRLLSSLAIFPLAHALA